MDQKQKILDFIKQQKLGVISTIHENGTPQSAVVGVAEKDTLQLIFGTSNTTRKYKNIQRNPNISFVIGWDFEKRTTVQYEGTARELTGEEKDECAAILGAKNELAKKFSANPNQRYFIVDPKWIRYSNLGLNPPEIFEISF